MTCLVSIHSPEGDKFTFIDFPRSWGWASDSQKSWPKYRKYRPKLAKRKNRGARWEWQASSNETTSRRAAANLGDLGELPGSPLFEEPRGTTRSWNFVVVKTDCYDWYWLNHDWGCSQQPSHHLEVALRKITNRKKTICFACIVAESSPATQGQISACNEASGSGSSTMKRMEKDEKNPGKWHECDTSCSMMCCRATVISDGSWVIDNQAKSYWDAEERDE